MTSWIKTPQPGRTVTGVFEFLRKPVVCARAECPAIAEANDVVILSMYVAVPKSRTSARLSTLCDRIFSISIRRDSSVKAEEIGQPTLEAFHTGSATAIAMFDMDWSRRRFKAGAKCIASSRSVASERIAATAFLTSCELPVQILDNK